MIPVISPSLLAGDFARAGYEVERLEKAGADRVHLDVMDGHFVPNITFGADFIKAIRSHCSLPFDVHLMISEPQKYLKGFADAGTQYLTIHEECDADIGSVLKEIHALGMKTGISLKPATPAEKIEKYLPETDLILVMTVEPGFGGQAFMEDMLPKIKRCRELADMCGRKIEIAVDGGISVKTIGKTAAAGADVFVAGSAVFKASDMSEAIEELRAAACEKVEK